jgi:hypothetical protein
MNYTKNGLTPLPLPLRETHPLPKRDNYPQTFTEFLAKDAKDLSVQPACLLERGDCG